MNLNFESKARSLIEKHFARPDWIDIGVKDCFVCGTPIDKDEFEKRSQVAVNDLAEALRSVHDEALESAMNVAINVIPCESICHCASEVAEEIEKLKGPKTS